MIQSQYTVQLSETAEKVYCDIYRQATEDSDISTHAAAEFRSLDEALDSIPLNPTDIKRQLTGRFAALYRLKTSSHCIIYRPENDNIFIVEISPLVNGDCQIAQRLLDRIVTTPDYKEARAALGIAETLCATTTHPTSSVN